VERASGGERPGTPLSALVDGWIPNLLVLLVAGIVYIPALFGSPVWDDRLLMSGAGIGGGDSLLHCFTRPFLFGYFRPLVSVTFYLDERLFPHSAQLPPSPVFFHVTNILIHMASTALVMGLVSCALPQARGESRLAARRRTLLAGLLFAVQPVQVTAVAFVGGRTDALAALFTAAIGWSIIASARATGRRSVALCLLGALIYAVALFAKEQLAMLLPLAPLAYVCFRPEEPAVGERPWRKAVFALLAFGAATLAFGIVWRRYAPALPFAHSLPAGPHAVQVGDTLLYYGLALLIPTPAGINIHSLGMFRYAGALSASAGLALFLAALLAAAAWLRRRRPAAWFLCLVLLPLLPVANVTPLSSFLVASYRAAACGVGIVALIAMALEGLRLRERERTGERPASGAGGYGAWPGIVAAALLTCWWISVTVRSAAQWKSQASIAGAVASYDPAGVAAAEGYCLALWDEGRLPEAAAANEAALAGLFGRNEWQDGEAVSEALKRRPGPGMAIIQLEEEHLPPRTLVTLLYADLGGIYLEEKDRTRSFRNYRIALEIDPATAAARMGMGEYAGADADYAGAERWLRGEMAAGGSEPEACLLLGDLISKQGRRDEALSSYEEAIRLQPEVEDGYLSMAEAYLDLGRRSDAIRTLEDATRLCRDPARALRKLKEAGQ
jgi:tetratricopeptide (TPR) repeat protein